MAWSVDARIPLVTVADVASLVAAVAAAGTSTAVLAETLPAALPLGAVTVVGMDLATPSHVAGCVCCAGRSPAAAALDRLFQARVRNACPWFDRVVVLAESEAARAGIAAALSTDALASARFRAAEK